jgi:uncharacterized protein (TIGR00725 family)
VIVAVVGDGMLPADDPRERFAEALGRGVIEQGWRLQTGGLGGVMAAASRGGRSSPRWAPGSVVGLLPGLDPGAANPHVDLAVPTGFGHARNWLVAQADAVVGVGGGAGTLTELGFAWILDRLVLGRRGEGWAGRLADQRLDERVRFPSIPDDRVYGVDTAEEALELLVRLLPRYRPTASLTAGGTPWSARTGP